MNITASDIGLSQIIAHILDNDPVSGSLTLSAAPVAVSSGDPVHQFFVEHVHAGLTSNHSNAARFSDTNGVAASAATDLLEGTIDLVAGSGKLAQRLFDVIKGDKRISPCVLAVCPYRVNGGPEHLAVLKLDNTSMLQPRTEVKDGHTVVTFEVSEDALPSDARLQKSAFIRPTTARDEYDLMLVDKQRPSEKGVAKFFQVDFLGADLALDDGERTRRLMKALVIAKNNLRPHQTEMQRQNLHHAVENALRSTEVSTTEFIRALNLPAKQKEEIDALLTKHLPDKTVKVDPKVTEKYLQQRKFRGDHGLDIRINRDAPDTMMSVKPVTNSDGPPQWEITILTKKWQETT